MFFLSVSIVFVLLCFVFAGEVVCDDPDLMALCDNLKATGLISLLEDRNEMFTLFAPSNEAFDALGAFVSVEEMTEILRLQIILKKAETFDSLICNGFLKTALDGQSTETLCKEVPIFGGRQLQVDFEIEKYQKGVGNKGAIETLPKLNRKTIIAGNGNVLCVNKVLLPAVPTIGKYLFFVVVG